MTLVRSEQPVTRWRHGSLNDQLPIGAYSPRHLVDDPLVSTRRVFSSHTLTRVCAWLMERPFINSHLTPMPMTLTRPTRERNPKARKMRILVAAGVVFAKAGFAAGSVREISLKARVNVASINYYFSSKEGLYREVLLAAHRKLLEQEPPPKPTPRRCASPSLPKPRAPMPMPPRRPNGSASPRTSMWAEPPCA